jgi:hypothetical protein
LSSWVALRRDTFHKGILKEKATILIKQKDSTAFATGSPILTNGIQGVTENDTYLFNGLEFPNIKGKINLESITS